MWLLVGAAGGQTIAFGMYMQNATSIYGKVFQLGTGAAESCYAIPPLCMAFLSPLGGLLIDKVGRKSQAIIIQSAVQTLGNFMITVLITQFTYASPNYTFLIPLFCVSLIFVPPTFQTSLPYIVTPQSLGTAYGVTSGVMNILVTAMPYIDGSIISGKITDSNPQYGYGKVILIATGFSFLGLLFAIWLLLDDIRNRQAILSRSGHQLRQEEANSTELNEMELPLAKRSD